jgi:hypothetical protein
MLTKSKAKVVGFPPIIFFLTLIFGFLILQGYTTFAGTSIDTDEAEAIPHLNPVVTVENKTYSPDSWVHVSVKVVEEHHKGEPEHNHEDEQHHGEVEHSKSAHSQEHEYSEGETSEEKHSDEEETIIEGAHVTIIIYDPKGNIYAVKKGVTDNHGEAEFEIHISPDASTGTYSVLPKATVEGSPIVIGESVLFEVST